MSLWDDEEHELLRAWKELQVASPEPEWINKLLETPAGRSDLAERAVVGLVDQYLQSRVRDASRTVKELEDELYVRQQLHDQSTGQIEYQISHAALALDHFKGWAVGYNRGIDDKRIELERTLRELRREKRTTRVQVWDDLVRLRGELRERRREYYAALRRATLQDTVR